MTSAKSLLPYEGAFTSLWGTEFGCLWEAVIQATMESKQICGGQKILLQGSLPQMPMRESSKYVN